MANALVNAVLLYGALVLQALLLVRLCRLRPWKRYPVLVTYLAFSLIRGTALLYYLRSGDRLFGFKGYGLLYAATRPILWIFYFLIIIELYSLMLEQYSGIRRLGRLILLVSLATVTVLSCVMLLLDNKGNVNPDPLLSSLLLEERSIFLCLSVLMFLLVLFASHYQLSIRRNVWVLCVSFAGYFTLDTVVFALWRRFGTEFAPLLNLANACFHTLALLGGVLFVSADGEKETESMPALWGSSRRELETSLLTQLQSFDAVLTKVLRS